MENQHLKSNSTKEAEHLSEIISFGKWLHSMKNAEPASCTGKSRLLSLSSGLSSSPFSAIDASSPHHGAVHGMYQARYQLVSFRHHVAWQGELCVP